jgi:hypothetical protein
VVGCMPTSLGGFQTARVHTKPTCRWGRSGANSVNTPFIMGNLVIC